MSCVAFEGCSGPRPNMVDKQVFQEPLIELLLRLWVCDYVIDEPKHSFFCIIIQEHAMKWWGDVIRCQTRQYYEIAYHWYGVKSATTNQIFKHRSLGGSVRCTVHNTLLTVTVSLLNLLSWHNRTSCQSIIDGQLWSIAHYGTYQYFWHDKNVLQDML